MGGTKQKARAVRSSSGVYMIELIMALAVSSMLAAALVANLSDSDRFANAGQNQILAFAIAQELIDNARNTPYGSLQTGTYDIAVNKDSGPPGGTLFTQAVQKRALLLDMSNQNWSPDAKKNRFDPQVVVEVAIATDIPDVPNNSTKRVKIEISWKEGNANRNYKLQTLISEHGIHN